MVNGTLYLLLGIFILALIVAVTVKLVKGRGELPSASTRAGLDAPPTAVTGDLVDVPPELAGLETVETRLI